MVTPPRCGQTNKVKLLPSRRTTYAGGKKKFTKTTQNMGMFWIQLSVGILTLCKVDSQVRLLLKCNRSNRVFPKCFH